ncbi:ATP-binding protein [Bdellovibrio sp. NC01]|uniref:ATP-binding protein n=1 Tax=Bdellovibrio sp. NC01 TaxID=2220073 RepID=UPI00115AE6CD|nr:ATP-binding protein [Bdellovibrio sp. NC01]QDK36410.1 hypothetical protein DOE51_01735 [Bdellovibrio sp. NC01]
MNKTNQVIDFIKDRSYQFGTVPFLKIADNERALFAVENYLQSSDVEPLIVLGPVGSGKTHLVGSVLFAQKDEGPQISLDCLISFCLRLGIMPLELDCAAIVDAFKTIFIDCIDFALRKRVSQDWLIFLEDVSRMGCKVISTVTDLWGWSHKNFRIVEISMSVSGKQQLAQFFFTQTFRRDPITDDELTLCSEASKERSFRATQGYIKKGFMLHELGESIEILWKK